MDTETILQLYPPDDSPRNLQGLYLSHELRKVTEYSGPFVYSNYVTSLDGRIAVPHPTSPGLMVPEAVANARDWRLFQELAVQADILFTSGRYLRDYADGRAQEILRVHEDPLFADLADWRTTNGLPLQPDLAVISASLNFPVPEALTAGGRRLVVMTVESAEPKRVAELEKQAEVVVVGKHSVDGRRLVDALAARGYRFMYNATGPKVLHMLLASGQLNRLYLTYANRLLGGNPYSTIVEGDLLLPPADFRLRTLYYDPHGLDGLGQLFASYDRA